MQRIVLSEKPYGWRAAAPMALLAVAACTSEGASDVRVEDELVQLETSTGTLSGALRLPAQPDPHPVVLLIAGSGAIDGNGNSAAWPGRNDSLLLLAEALAERGVASLRFDKRGVGRSLSAAPPEPDLRFETHVDDAAGWLEQLHLDARFSSRSVVGHSEGSLVGLLAVKRLGNTRFVSVAGPARRASDLLRDQLEPQLQAELWEESDRILRSLEAGQAVSDVSPELAALFRASVQPYLISWFRYVPAEEIATLDAAALIVQGTTDIQVAVSEAEALHAAKPDSELLIIDGMNHVLKLVPPDREQQIASYSDPSLPVHTELIDAVASFAR